MIFPTLGIILILISATHKLSRYVLTPPKHISCAKYNISYYHMTNAYSELSVSEAPPSVVPGRNARASVDQVERAEDTERGIQSSITLWCTYILPLSWEMAPQGNFVNISTMVPALLPNNLPTLSVSSQTLLVGWMESGWERMGWHEQGGSWAMGGVFCRQKTWLGAQSVNYSTSGPAMTHIQWRLESPPM